jgi:putative transposase
MKQMGLKAVYAKPRTTIINKEHNKYPYLLRGLIIDKANQVWSTDITYIKMPKGFVYLIALIDIFSRFIISWQISVTMDIEFCVITLNQALKLGRPDIINTDQGSQFTSNEWIRQVLENSIKVSMDGIGRWADNIYIERFWRTAKQEQIYINLPDNISELKEQIEQFINFYNYQRPHQSLSYKTPSQIYYGDNNRKMIDF